MKKRKILAIALALFTLGFAVLGGCHKADGSSAASECTTEDAGETTGDISDETESVTEKATEKGSDKETEEEPKTTKDDSEETTGDDSDETTVDDSDETTGAEDESTEKAGEEATEKGTEKVTEAATEKVTEKATEKATDRATEAATEKATEAATQSAVSDAGTADGTVTHVTVHDPSIVEGTDSSGKKCYYIFGSHLAFAYSYDLKNWKTFTNNISTSYKTLMAEGFDWADNGDTVYNPSGNMWAPDVIYNKALGKWCMYMSINGCSWNSVIVLLTADNLMGNWTYVGPVVYSGFTADATRSYTLTDYVKATGDTDFANAERYTRNAYVCKDGSTSCTATTWNYTYGAHAIDPSVFYDKSGNLWMSYGSWSGGIYLIRLDNATGLRDYTVKYADMGSESWASDFTDPYMGYHIAGGYGTTGEASYIVYDAATDYYYLYVSYWGLTREGGYQIRMFRSKDVTGTYVDADGTRAAARGSSRDSIGIKLFGNYYFSSLAQGNGNYTNGYMAGGHNSAFIDGSGNRFLVYHTRFNCGQEWHEVRVHQQFLNEDGWPVTAVYEYRGDEISTTGYSMDMMAGEYELIDMGLTNDGANVNKSVKITFNSDGTISGAKSGTWTYNNQYVTMVIGGVTYKGVFFYQQCETKAHEFRMTFSLIGTNDTCLWGSK